MTEDTKDPNTEVAAANQAAANSENPTSAGSLSAGATGDASVSAPNSASAPSAVNTPVADPNVSGSGLADVLAGATDRLAAVSTAGVSDPNSNAAASTSSGSSTLSGSANTGNVAAVKADSDFINDPASQKPSLAGTSGKAPGTNATGMAVDAGVEKLTPAQAATGGNPGVDTPSVNVRTSGAVHPIVHTVQQHTAELRTILGNQKQTPWMMRALKDLQTMEEWVVQHFEELRRKV